MEIPGFSNYLIYEDGKCLSKSRVKSHNGKNNQKELFLKPRQRKKYFNYRLYDGTGKSTTVDIHRLVAETYIANPNKYPFVNHKDGNTFNNHKDNLEWCTRMYNNQTFNKINQPSGTVIKREGVKITTYRGRIAIYGKIYWTLSKKTPEEVQTDMDNLIERFK